MKTSFFRVSAVALAVLVASPVLGQEAAETSIETNTGDDGFDWGWLGLLGLVGLAGLSGRRRDNVTSTTR